MTELSPDARDLIAQARKQGPGLMGPSAADRARLREKLAPMWGQAPRPRPALHWKRYALSSAGLIAGIGWLCWLLFWSPDPETSEHTGAAPLTAANAPLQPTAAAEAAPTNSAPTVATATATATATEATVTAAPGRPAAPTAAASPAQPAHLASKKPVSANGRERARPALEAPSGAAQADAHEQTALPASARIAPQAGSATATPPAAAAASAQAQPEVPARSARPEHTPAEASPLTAAAADSSNRAVRTDSRPAPRSIEGELELLGEAQAALQAARPSRALNLLQDHAFRFPAGALIEERMVMQALALCALDRKNAAASVLSSLAARGSRSALLPRVRRQCGL